MNSPSARHLAEVFYAAEELEFLQPHGRFPAERELVRSLIEQAQKLEPKEFHAFSRDLIGAVSSFCQNNTLHPGVLLRAFDGVDEVLQIDYEELAAMMPKADAAERLYEGGGVGVQTSYSTITKVLEHLKLSESSHLVDLGSGFGRVGLTAGLWRQDLKFTGYEFVGHRVAASNASAERAGLGQRVRFFQQDLSDRAFLIPAADAYYLYDPFSAATYEHICARLSALGRERETVIIAKAGARNSLRRWMNEDEWHDPESLDEDTILLFRSRS